MPAYFTEVPAEGGRAIVRRRNPGFSSNTPKSPCISWLSAVTALPFLDFDCRSAGGGVHRLDSILAELTAGAREEDIDQASG
jgi:hypothetical protein